MLPFKAKKHTYLEEGEELTTLNNNLEMRILVEGKSQNTGNPTYRNS